MGRTLDINPVYGRFFLKNLNERYIILQGGRRSGKSISVYQWVTILLLSSKKECVVLTSSYPSSTNAIKDFTLATGLPVSGNAIYGNCHIFENGSVISFKAFDDPTKAQGTFANIAVVEEALNIPEQTFTVFSMSVTDQIYFLYNPTKTSWTDKYLKPDKSNYLKTTWKDNPYLGEEQIKEFELIRERSERPNATILDIYNRKVYYDGDYSDMSGRVFMEVHTCTEEQFDRVPVQESYGLDFGFVDNRDFNSLVAVKIHDNILYAKELIYSNELSKDEDLVRELKKAGVTMYTTVAADYGGLGKTRIQRIANDYGLDLINCQKNKIIDDIRRILQFDRIVVTENSFNLRREMDGYELTNEGKPVGSDHALDAMRYAYNFARVNQGW